MIYVQVIPVVELRYNVPYSTVPGTGNKKTKIKSAVILESFLVSVFYVRRWISINHVWFYGTVPVLTIFESFCLLRYLYGTLPYKRSCTGVFFSLKKYRTVRYQITSNEKVSRFSKTHVVFFNKTYKTNTMVKVLYNCTVSRTLMKLCCTYVRTCITVHWQ